MNLTEDQVALAVAHAARQSSMNSARSVQQSEHRIGASEIGMCRNYLRHMTIQTPYDDGAEDNKFAAFVGTAIGDRLEWAYGEENEGAMLQAEFDATLPNGMVIPCHSDIIDTKKNILIDLKAKNGLSMVRGETPDRSHIYQVAIYLLGAIQAGYLQEGATAYLVYVDRSAADPVPFHAIEVVVDDFLYGSIVNWIEDAMYAVQTGEEASRDRPYQWCEVACPFFSSCRGQETLSEGVIDDPEVSLAAKKYREALDQERDAKRVKEDAMAVLQGKSGFIPDVGLNLSWTFVPESNVAYQRGAYTRINLRKPPARKSKKEE